MHGFAPRLLAGMRLTGHIPELGGDAGKQGVSYKTSVKAAALFAFFEPHSLINESFSLEAS